MSPRSHFLTDRYKHLLAGYLVRRTVEYGTDILQRYKGGFPHDTTGHHWPATETSMFKDSSSWLSFASTLRATGQRYGRGENHWETPHLLT